jgi:hypothetical protein
VSEAETAKNADPAAPAQETTPIGAADDAQPWLSQSECARRLNDLGDPVVQQVLSRYLERYPEIPRRADGPKRAVLVDFEALRAHRLQNVRVQEERAASSSSPASAPSPSSPPRDDAADLRLRERRAAAEKAEFDLAKARGELIPRAAVERAIRAAGVELEHAMKSTRLERAEQLENSRDARAKVAILLAQDDALREAFAAALIQLASGATEEEIERDAADGEQIGDENAAAATTAGETRVM